MEKTLILHNDLQEVPQLALFIDAIAEACGIDPSTSMSLNLAVEEAVVNVMNYAYPPQTVGEIELHAAVEGGAIEFNLIDSGVPFDPTAGTPPDTTLSAEERPIGGLGIFLVGQIMDTVAYRRTDGRNILTMRKTLNNIK